MIVPIVGHRVKGHEKRWVDHVGMNHCVRINDINPVVSLAQLVCLELLNFDRPLREFSLADDAELSTNLMSIAPEKRIGEPRDLRREVVDVDGKNQFLQIPSRVSACLKLSTSSIVKRKTLAFNSPFGQ